jgi:Recombinase
MQCESPLGARPVCGEPSQTLRAGWPCSHSYIPVVWYATATLLLRPCWGRYPAGQESDSTIAAWLNATGARTARERPFGKDTVREMLCNAAYAGYVSGLRDKSRAIRGLHEPIISDELFDRGLDLSSCIR